jgi:fructose 1,6-bisphosphate aldolase/phosphatase
LAQKIYAKAEEVAKELNLSPLVKRKLANGDYNKPYMITEMEVSERKSEPLLIFTSNAVPGSFNPWGLEMFTNPNTTYGLVIDKNMMGSFSFGIRDTQTGKKVRLNFAEGQQRMFTLALAGTQPFRYINTEVFPNKAPTLPKDLSPDEPVAVASYITMPNKEQISVLMVRSQSGLPAVGEGIEPAGYAYPVAIGAGYYRGLFPAKQKDSATTGLSAKVTALGFQLAHGYLQKPRDVFDDKSFDPSRADALKKSEMLAKMGVIEPGAISVEPEDLLKALEGRWFELPKAGDIYQSKPSKTGKPKITVSLIKADVGGWVGHTDVNPDILKAARDTLRWAMGEISTIFSKKKNLRQLFVKAIEMETRRAQDLNPDVSAKAKKELENIEAAISFIEANPGLLGDIYVTDGGDDLELLMLHRNGVNNGKIHTLALHTLYLCGKLAEYHKQYNFLQDLIVDVSKHTGTVQGMGPGVAELDMEEEDGKAFVAAMLMDKTSAAAFSKFIPEAFTNFYHAATLQGPENVRYRGYILELWNVKTHRGIYLDMQTEMHIVNALLSETEGRWQKRIYPVQKEYWSLKEGIILVDKDGHKLTLADVKEDDPIFVASTEKLFAIGGDKYKGKDDPVGLLVEEAAMPYSLEAVPGKTVPGGLRGSTDAPLMPVATKDAHPTRLDQPPRIVALGFNIANGQFSKPLDYFEDPRFDRAREEAMNIYGALRPLGPRPPSLTLHPEYTSVPEVLKEMDKLQLWQPATAASSALTKKTGGIDFRNKAMTINYEPMGNFSQLNFNLPKLSAKALASFDVEQEFAQVENMVERGLLPSGERIKELLAACSQKGELESRQERIMVLLVKMGMLEEENCCTQEASKEFKEALVLAESLS